MTIAYRTILAATDLSTASVEGLERAADLAKRLGSRLQVAYVADNRLPPMVLAASAESEEKILARHVATARKHLSEFAADHLAGFEAEIIVLEGSAHEAIVAYAADNGVDLIVCATHGHGPIGHVLMGSTTERILHHAPCPVLVVRSPNHE